MDRQQALEAFHEQMRRRPSDDVNARAERDRRVTRFVSQDGSWNAVVWSDLDETNADAVIAEQIERFASAAEPWEWKYYSYDQPLDLPRRLVDAGFAPEPEEALLVAEIAELDLGVTPPDGVDVRLAADDADIQALVDVHDEVFGGDHAPIGDAIRSGLAAEPSTVAAFVAWAEAGPVSSGRVEFHHGTDFASIWGGGTLPAWRGRGVFRSLVACRAAEAAARGFRYLQVDASPDSRPILERLGFVQLATTTPFLFADRTDAVAAPGVHR
jgi:GNAT superfamily N-acetyltransferase